MQRRRRRRRRRRKRRRGKGDAIVFEAEAESFHFCFFIQLIRRKRNKKKRKCFYFVVGPDEEDEDDDDDEDEEEAVPGNSNRKALGLCKGILARCFPSFLSKASLSATLNKTAAPRASNGPVTCGGTPGICCKGVGWVWVGGGVEGGQGGGYFSRTAMGDSTSEAWRRGVVVIPWCWKGRVDEAKRVYKQCMRVAT